MKALTIDAVWAWAIFHAGKRVENRSWNTNHRGPLAIHAGKGRRRDAEAREQLRKLGVEPPSDEELESWRGAVVGTVEVLDAVHISQSRALLPDSEVFDVKAHKFASGPWCWVLGSPELLPAPVPCVGHQGFWSAPIG